MKRQIQQLLGEAKGKMNGYVSLMVFRYSNLCVNADAASLLPVTIVIDDEEMNIEAVADVGIPDENVLAVIPKDPDNLFAIGKGVMKAHPEFRMDLVQNENSDDEEDKYLTFTMPEVDKNRHDLLIDGVDGLYQQCETRVSAVLDIYSVRIGKELVGVDPSVIDAVKDQLQELHDFFKDLMEKATETKKKEIEDAYQAYLAEQAEKEQQKQETDAAHNVAASMSMKMEMPEEE